jgi:hypothetical protein
MFEGSSSSLGRLGHRSPTEAGLKEQINLINKINSLIKEAGSRKPELRLHSQQ